MQTTTTPAIRHLSLSPLGAGDLIDRTVRLYRRHFMTLIRAAAPPVVGAAVGAVLWTVSTRAIPVTESAPRLVAYFALAGAGAVLMLCGNFFFLIVIGGASRNLVMHLLWGEPVSARLIYRCVRARFWGLALALLLISALGSAVGVVIFFVWFVLLALVMGIAFGFGATGPLGVVFLVVLTVASTVAALFCFFWVVGRLAYVPQVMLVEGRGVFDAVGRSVALARGNVRRLTAMFLFTTFATYSALMLLVVPLGWYGYLQGINPVAFEEADWPLWYAVSYQALTQVSYILLAPVWMLGLSLLYVDERVRHEGYDIELLAQQRLGDMPALPGGGPAPLTPALHTAAQNPPHAQPPPRPQRPGSLLGLSR